MNQAKGKPTIDSEIERVLIELSKLEADSESYTKIVQNLDGLCKARSYKRDSKIPWEVLIYSGTSFIELLFVLNFERLNVLPKAIGYILKVRP